MNMVAVDRNPEERLESRLGGAEERELGRLLRRWREEGGLTADEENRFAHLLNVLVARQAAWILEDDAFLCLLSPYADGTELSPEERRDLLRLVRPLLGVRVLTEDDKQELGQIFDRYRMRLWSRLNRSIGATLEAKFGPDDVLQEAYIRAMTRWPTRPEDPKKQYVWLYGIVHEQFCDMLRRAQAAKRGDTSKHVRVPDNSAAEVALQFYRSQTGASTVASRSEFVARFQEFLEQHLSRADLEVFSMRVFDRLEYPEIVTELVRRAEASHRAGVYEDLLDELDARSQDDEMTDQEASKRRSDAIRKRFKRAVAQLSGAILTEFPELLDALPDLQLGRA